MEKITKLTWKEEEVRKNMEVHITYVHTPNYIEREEQKIK